MCGIAVIVDSTPSPPYSGERVGVRGACSQYAPLTLALSPEYGGEGMNAIERMTQSLRHRGPDAQACLRLPGCEFGHTRLSIIDPAGGAQPMSDEQGRFHVVFNGEIYNHVELRRELESVGARFRTRCDTEVLLHAYRQFGRNMLARLNGQFAFAIWDA